MVEEFLGCSFVGDRDAVAEDLARFIERTGADEVIVATQVHDHQARLRSYELLAQGF